MYEIYEDDYAQTTFPSLDSDGAVELYWDHPDFPKKWSGRYCDHYPYDNWSEIKALRPGSSTYGVWSIHNIILGHFGLYKKGLRMPWADVLSMEPDGLKKISDEIFQTPEFEKTCHLLVPEFDEINRELFEYFANNPSALHGLHWRRFELLLQAIFKNQGFLSEVGPGSGDGGVDLRLIQKDSIGEVITLVQAKKYSSKYPVKLEAVSALYGVVEANQANRGLFVTTSSYLPSSKKFAEDRGSKLILAGQEEIVKWCRDVSSS